MANVVEIFFIMQFLVAAIVTVLKILNLVSLGKMYDKKLGLLMFAAYIVAWFLALIVVLSDPKIIFYSMIFRFESLFVVVHVVFVFGELMLSAMDQATQGVRQGYRTQR